MSGDSAPLEYYGHCSVCGQYILAGMGHACSTQFPPRATCAVCGRELFPPTYMHDCPNVRVISTQVKP
jgi:hypothetical protein